MCYVLNLKGCLVCLRDMSRYNVIVSDLFCYGYM